MNCDARGWLAQWEQVQLSSRLTEGGLLRGVDRFLETFLPKFCSALTGADNSCSRYRSSLCWGDVVAATKSIRLRKVEDLVWSVVDRRTMMVLIRQFPLWKHRFVHITSSHAAFAGFELLGVWLCGCVVNWCHFLLQLIS
jgi:hypothetical protein